MKIKIDTEEKTIQVEGKANFKELNAFFNKAFTEEELKEYTLIQTNTIKSTVNKILKDSKNIDSEFNDIVNDNFYDLI